MIWQNGELKNWEDATVHVMAHGLHYGSTVFEGIRSYQTKNGPAIFRLREHIQRLFDSCKVYHMPIPYKLETIEAACCDVVRSNELGNSYVRPIVYCDVDGLGLVPSESAIGVAIGAIEWGPLLGKEALEKGTHICVSSWSRPQSNSNPMMSKAGGHYLTSQLISREARLNGYNEGIAVNQNGIITEGAGSNLFMVKQGKIYTPPLGCSILAGITRDSVIQMALREGFEIVESNIPREALYTADEVFLCGTAAEITPVASIDRLDVADGKPGPVTRKIQSQFFDLVAGRLPDEFGWLHKVNATEKPLTVNGKHVGNAGTLSY